VFRPQTRPGASTRRKASRGVASFISRVLSFTEYRYGTRMGTRYSLGGSEIIAILGVRGVRPPPPPPPPRPPPASAYKGSESALSGNVPRTRRGAAAGFGRNTFVGPPPESVALCLGAFTCFCTDLVGRAASGLAA